jgi:hypothetical protein
MWAKREKMRAKSGVISELKSTALTRLEKVIWKLGLDDPLCLRQGVRKNFAVWAAGSK